MVIHFLRNASLACLVAQIFSLLRGCGEASQLCRFTGVNGSVDNRTRQLVLLTNTGSR